MVGWINNFPGALWSHSHSLPKEKKQLIDRPMPEWAKDLHRSLLLKRIAWEILTEYWKCLNSVDWEEADLTSTLQKLYVQEMEHEDRLVIIKAKEALLASIEAVADRILKKAEELRAKGEAARPAS